MENIEKKMEEGKKRDADSAKNNAQKMMTAFKALTAMRLTKEDSVPGEIYPDIYLGSIGCAYNKEAMLKIGITHILCCAANIKPRFPDVSKNKFKEIFFNLFY